MTELDQQHIEDQQYHYRVQLETIQESQLENRKQQVQIEVLQERFYQLQQQEQAIYEECLFEVEPEERSFFEERKDEGIQFSRKAFQQLEQQQEELVKEARELVTEETTIQANQETFLKKVGKAVTHGT